MKYKGFSFVELLVVLAILGLLGSLLLPAAARTLQASRRNTCQDNLKALGTAFRVYANENRGWYPRMHADQPFGSKRAAAGCAPESFTDRPSFSPDLGALYPEYLTDLGLLICPSAPNTGENPLRIVEDDGSGACRYTGLPTGGDRSYFYLGYALDKVDAAEPGLPNSTAGPAQVVALVAFMSTVLSNRDPLDDALLERDADLTAIGLGGLGLGNDNGDIVLRLRNDIEETLGTSADLVPILWDRVGRAPDGAIQYNHQPGGCNVLYLDGHVSFTSFADEFPATPAFADLATVF